MSDRARGAPTPTPIAPNVAATENTSSPFSDVDEYAKNVTDPESTGDADVATDEDDGDDDWSF